MIAVAMTVVLKMVFIFFAFNSFPDASLNPLSLKTR
jgi:hypothetical protein